MKKITLLFLSLLTVSLGYAQATHTIDFEPAGTGSGWNWTVTEVAPTLTEIANPVSGGINTSATVVEFVAHTTDNNWALCYTDDNNTFTFDGSNATVKIMVYKPTISEVAIKFEGDGVAKEIGVSNTVTNQWEELTYDFSSEIGKTFTRMVIIPDFVKPYVTGKDRAADNTLYFDNIQAPEGAVVESCSDGILNNGETEIDCGGPNCEPCELPDTPPTVAAPTPPARAASDVLSIYSDAYPAISAINYDQSWCGSPAVEQITVESDNVFAYKDKACQGIGFETEVQDATGFTHIHIDLFIEVGTDIVGKVFNLKAVPTAGGESEFPIDINALDPKPVPGEWYSYDAAISFSGSTVDIKQFGITSNFSNAVWYDNLYFHKDTELSVNGIEIAGLQTYPNPTNNSWTISTESQVINSVEIFNVLGEHIISVAPNALSTTIDGSSLATGIYVAKINTDLGTATTKLIKN